MRSLSEIRFRITQELRNAKLALRPPTLANQHLQFQPLPLPGVDEIIGRIRGTGCEQQILLYADEVLKHKFTLLGYQVETGPEIAWRRDYLSGLETAPLYFRRIPYLDPAIAGDHKNIWELNRHQHLVLLAQAWALTKSPAYADELIRQLRSWLEQNRFQFGINWTSALEVAFRAWSWMWVIHLAHPVIERPFLQQLLTALYQHGVHIEHNLSVYFSPNTHLLGEAVVLHLMGVMFPQFPRAAHWRRWGGSIVLQQMGTQVRPDGSHFEQSSYYHVYALDFFLLHRIFSASVPSDYDDRLRGMAEYLRALLGPQWRIPPLGDDDGGRLFHPYGERLEFGRATMATCGALFDRPDWVRAPGDLDEQAIWWLGPAAAQPARTAALVSSELFRDAGVAVLASGGVHAVADVGPFGAGSAGHSHSDTLSLTVCRDSEWLLADSGTFTYMGALELRDWFRGSAAHNTVRIGQVNQASASGRFRWLFPPEVSVLDWRTSEEEDRIEGLCRYSGFSHRRRVLFLKPRLFLIEDELSGPSETLIEQFWQVGEPASLLSPRAVRIGESAILAVWPHPMQLIESWRSEAFGQRRRTHAACVSLHSKLPLRLFTVLDVSSRDDGGLRVDGSVIHWAGKDYDLAAKSADARAEAPRQPEGYLTGSDGAPINSSAAPAPKAPNTDTDR